MPKKNVVEQFPPASLKGGVSFLGKKGAWEEFSQGVWISNQVSLSNQQISGLRLPEVKRETFENRPLLLNLCVRLKI